MGCTRGTSAAIPFSADQIAVAASLWEAGSADLSNARRWRRPQGDGYSHLPAGGGVGLGGNGSGGGTGLGGPGGAGEGFGLGAGPCSMFE